MTFSEAKSKKTKKKGNELTFPFAQEPFIQLRPFVQIPAPKKKKGNVNDVP
jgi:hypothetical protein